MKHPYFRPTAITISVLLAALMLAGCAHTRESSAAMDAVSGYYAGHWYGPNPEKALGTLDCTITAKGEDAWDAHFVATFGEVGEYEVPLEGKRTEGKVLFGGAVDLGESEGGVFEWTGEIVDEVFNGEYTARGYTGTFKMTKTERPAE